VFLYLRWRVRVNVWICVFEYMCIYMYVCTLDSDFWPCVRLPARFCFPPVAPPPQGGAGGVDQKSGGGTTD